MIVLSFTTKCECCAGDATRWSGSYSPTSPAYGRDHDPEEDHTPMHKKSVLAKVKERAIRWRQNLRKKKQSQDGNSTPSWGVSLDEDEDDGPDGDPEYLGAPSNNISLLNSFLPRYQQNYVPKLLVIILQCTNRRWRLRCLRKPHGSIQEKFR